MKKHEYLEIYPSEVAAKKISRHLDKMLTEKPRVYRKTLLRYKKLAQLLLDCVSKIIKMLQSEMLLSSDDNDEFQELVSEYEVEQIEELRNSVDTLDNFIGKTTPESVKRVAEDTLKSYKSTFLYASQFDFGYIEVNECANLLNYWISHRFSGVNYNFKFLTKQLPTWSTFIVIAYGKYHSLGYSRKFVDEFKHWCDSLAEDTNNCWALPYNVFNMTRNISPSDLTLDAMVIYDILMNDCLYQLVGSKNKIPLDSGFIVDMIKKYRPDLKSKIRTRISNQAKLIDDLRFIPSTDTSEVGEA